MSRLYTHAPLDMDDDLATFVFVSVNASWPDMCSAISHQELYQMNNDTNFHFQQQLGLKTSMKKSVETLAYYLEGGPAQ